MIARLSELALSLTGLMAREAAVLSGGGHSNDLAEIVGAKRRLAVSLEQQLADMARHDPDWHGSLPADEHRTLAGVLNGLAQAARASAAEPQHAVNPSRELIGAIGSEAQRLAEARHAAERRDGAPPAPFG
jgi:hypothetical protein